MLYIRLKLINLKTIGIKMKKILISAVFSLFAISSASAEIGVNVGASGQAGLFSASAQESTGSTAKGNGSEHGEAAYGSIFLEGVIGERFLIGIDYVPMSLESETTETIKQDKGVDALVPTAVENKVQVDFDDLTTLYAGIMVTDNMYVKAGLTSVEVKTNEDLGTGGSYGDETLDGTMIGVGYHNVLDNGIFFRVEGTYMTFDGATVTSTGAASNNSIKLSSLDGVTGKLSVGRSF